MEDMKNILKEADKAILEFEKMVDEKIEGYGLDKEFRYIPKFLSTSAINEITEDTLFTKLKGNFTDELTNKRIDTFKELYEKSNKEMSFIDYTKSIILSIKNVLNEEAQIFDNRDALEKAMKEVYEQQLEYMSSKEYIEKRHNMILKMEEDIKSEENPLKKKEMEAMVKTLSSVENLSFLFERLNKKGEAENIIDIFFHSKRSALVMDKFKAKISKFGFNADSYKNYFFIEEQFLDEVYHPLNNIFLFVAMRHIAYCDPDRKNDQLEAKRIMTMLSTLFYNKASEEAKQFFIDIITNVCNYFLPYIDEFVEKNIFAPKHPERIKKEAEWEETRRVLVINSLQKRNIEFDMEDTTENLIKLLESLTVGKNTNVEDSVEETAADSTEESVEETTEEDVE